MADISKCKGTNCPLAKTCWRYVAPGNEFWQAYLSEVPYDPQKKSCGDYWQIFPVGDE